MNIVYVYADTPEEWNSSEWRCAVPCRAINRTGRHHAEMLSIEDFANQTERSRQVCEQSEIIVIQRNLFGPVLAAMQHWKAQDKVIIADFDDAYDLIHPTNLTYPFWHDGLMKSVQTKMEPPPLAQFKWGLRIAHAATVPSKRLADDWQSFANIHYLPNFIDLNHYQNVTTPARDGVVIGWGGSMSHFQSFSDSGVMDALKRICRSRQNVKVMVCGNDARVWQALPLPGEQKILQPWVSYLEWPSILARFDIGLAPLDGEYDGRRSWIKVLEYMVMKIPWVASEGPPYQDLRQYGWLVNNTPRSWERVLLDLVDHLEDYQVEAAGGPYLAGISQSVDENVQQIISTYASIYETALGRQPAASTIPF